MALPSPLDRHQPSLEDANDLTEALALDEGQRARAQSRFYRIAQHFESDLNTDNTDNTSRSRNRDGNGGDGSRSAARYSPPLLVRLTYDHALSGQSRENFLRAFFSALALPVDGPQGQGEEDEDIEDLRSPFFGFADYLLDNFFLPRLCQEDPAAIAQILHLSAAGEYIDRLLSDMDGRDVHAIGTTELDRLVRLRLRG